MQDSSSARPNVSGMKLLPTGGALVVAVVLSAGCSSAPRDASDDGRFVVATDRAFEDGLAACDPSATRVLVLPASGDSLLDGEWFDRRTVERRQARRRLEHTREIEATLRERGWTVIEVDDATLRRLRRQHARLADDGFVSLESHVGSSLGAEVVVAPRLDFHYDAREDIAGNRWISTLDRAVDYRFIDVRRDIEIAERWVDTRDPSTIERWDPTPPEPALDDVGVLEASAPVEAIVDEAEVEVQAQETTTEPEETGA